MSQSPDSRILILGYHKVGRPLAAAPTCYYVSVETFRSQIEIIVTSPWQVIAFDTLLDALDGEAELPRRAVLLTFDDAYQGLCRTAAPILRERQLASTVFVPVNYVGRLNDFDRGIEPPEPICDWSDLRELRASGMSIASHTMSHRALSSLGVAEQVRELVESKRELERRLESRVRVVAYPYGDNGGDAIAAAACAREAGYEAACVYCGGVMHRLTVNRYVLERVPVFERTDLAMLLR